MLPPIQVLGMWLARRLAGSCHPDGLNMCSPMLSGLDGQLASVGFVNEKMHLFPIGGRAMQLRRCHTSLTNETRLECTCVVPHETACQVGVSFVALVDFGAVKILLQERVIPLSKKQFHALPLL